VGTVEGKRYVKDNGRMISSSGQGRSTYKKLCCRSYAARCFVSACICSTVRYKYLERSLLVTSAWN